MVNKYSKKSPIKNVVHINFTRPLLPATVVFIAVLAIIMVSWKTARQDIQTLQLAAVKERSAFVEGSIKQRFNIYEDTLRAANGLFQGSDNVTREEWKAFIESLNLPVRYPGIRAVSYVSIVNSETKDTFINNIHNEGITGFRIFPESDKPVYAVATYAVPTANQPHDDRNIPMLGYDLYSDPIRKKALDTATRTTQPILSDIVNIAVAGGAYNKGYIFVLPYYAPGLPTVTDQDRLAAIRGYFYAPFQSGDVFTSLFNNKDPNFGFEIYYGGNKPINLLYSSQKDLNKEPFFEFKKSDVGLYGQRITIVYKIRPELIAYSVRSRPTTVAIGGTIFAAAIALIVYLLIQRRSRALSYSEEKRLEEAKDELLSLASHQLRTPATAVKQYVSMVKDGFAGDITEDQKNLLQMAFDSNERQLTIVDDLLYVARVDAGKATLRKEQINLNSLIESVIDDQTSAILTRKQKVKFIQPKRRVSIVADPQYLRMILENLLSNASKYSNDTTTITVKLSSTNETVSIDFEDQGVGIDTKDYDAVFLKFSRIPNDLTRNVAGSGIGLYLAKQLAQLHSGDIIFVSKLGKGSTFTVSLPVRSIT